MNTRTFARKRVDRLLDLQNILIYIPMSVFCFLFFSFPSGKQKAREVLSRVVADGHLKRYHDSYFGTYVFCPSDMKVSRNCTHNAMFAFIYAGLTKLCENGWYKLLDFKVQPTSLEIVYPDVMATIQKKADNSIVHLLFEVDFSKKGRSEEKYKDINWKGILEPEPKLIIVNRDHLDWLNAFMDNPLQVVKI